MVGETADERKIRRRREKKGKEKQSIRIKVTGKEECGRKEERVEKDNLGLGGSSAMLCVSHEMLSYPFSQAMVITILTIEYSLH